ncbi:hypothetical protein Gasu2_56290 [Galdieria sulphuraria]|uniref:Uncharacterized protein n=1 Tax=Galdieria sulphuraria TaxID=130081 RepID=M2WYJ6_GALSU|nr:uncharacterized protein Gasu_33420 [Galdieria sulphuraria]EME29135.1 hypothetical protein Gasu_33420 [Galdieria sulphuraria]GJD11494.1 hypothetical protein Gasu2_56290 [Galdieria sulphuraria]|eukprot:XP_005705655.1 hypothetical protein Gasu_33420 [Galdieria sulphuraria]
MQLDFLLRCKQRSCTCLQDDTVTRVSSKNSVLSKLNCGPFIVTKSHTLLSWTFSCCHVSLQNWSLVRPSGAAWLLVIQVFHE